MGIIKLIHVKPRCQIKDIFLYTIFSIINGLKGKIYIKKVPPKERVSVSFGRWSLSFVQALVEALSSGEIFSNNIFVKKLQRNYNFLKVN